MSLAKLAKLLEDVPGCGTRFPGFHPPKHHAEPVAPVHDAGNPSHHAPGTDTRLLIVAALDCVRLFQLGQSLGGEQGAMLSATAEKLYDEGPCPSVPFPELIQLILHHWPLPGPSPWLQPIEAAVTMLRVARHANGLVAAELAKAAWEVIACQFCYLPCHPKYRPLDGSTPNTPEH